MGLPANKRTAMSSDPEEFEIVTVQSGARSLRARANGETFHPVVGPMVEARGLHVVQQRLVERAAATEGPFVIWDVGLGAAANAVAVLDAFPTGQIELHSFDLTTAPLEFALRHEEALEYVAPYRATIAQLLANSAAKLHGIEWRLHRGDFRQTLEDPAWPAPHAVLYDPYSPTANAELWTLEHFARLFARLDPQRGCLLTNYTRSTAVRVTLLLAGFFVGHGHATGEKDETTTAANGPGLLEEPLTPAWLERVRRSTRGAPLRAAGGLGQPIAEADWERLLEHPQFQAS